MQLCTQPGRQRARCATERQPSPAAGMPALSCGLCSCRVRHRPLPLQLLLSSGLTPEQRELTDTILESGNTLLTILGDILDFSKVGWVWGRARACICQGRCGVRRGRRGSTAGVAGPGTRGPCSAAACARCPPCCGPAPLCVPRRVPVEF